MDCKTNALQHGFEIWPVSSNSETLTKNVEAVLGAVTHLPVRFWKPHMFFTGAKDEDLSSFTLSQKKGSRPPSPWQPIAGQSLDLSGIAFPINKFVYESINKKDVLLHLAQHLWEEISDIWGKIPVWVDIWDLISWIGLHISMKGQLVKKEDSEGASLINGICDQTRKPDVLYYDRDLVRMWGENFANRLTVRERAVFGLQYGTNLKLKDIADELGYRGSSGAKYVIECIEGKLRFFLADLPWLSPDDFNRDAFRLFIDAILSVLNNAGKKP